MTPELRKRIDDWLIARMRALPGIPLPPPGLIDDLVAALEEADAVAEALRECEREAVRAVYEREETGERSWTLEARIYITRRDLPAAVAALRAAERSEK